MNDTLIDPTAVQVISGIGIALCSVALLVGVVLIFRVRRSHNNLPHQPEGIADNMQELH